MVMTGDMRALLPDRLALLSHWEHMDVFNTYDMSVSSHVSQQGST